MKKLVFFALFLIIAALVYKYSNQDKPAVTNNTSVILVSFGSKDNEGIWQGEVAPFMDNLENTQDVSEMFPLCQQVLKGDIYGQKVLVVIGGMAKVNMSSCTTNLLFETNGHVKEIILSGIAGITPMKGGVKDITGNLRNDDPTMLGDVCVNSAAFDFDLQRYSSDKANDNSPIPDFWLPEYENSSNKITGSMPLSNELFRASLQVEWPDPSEKVKEKNYQYHKTSRRPKPWGPKECLEITDDLFWHDIRADKRARELGASWLSQVGDININEEDIVIVTAMEAIPVGVVVDHWNNTHATDIDFAYVRSASNFDHAWLNQDGTPAVDGRRSLETGMNIDLVEFAAESASLPILKMFELRSR